MKKIQTVELSIVKATIAAVIAPVVIFITMFFINDEYSVISVGVWFFFASMVYKTTDDKQLTAYFFFKILIFESVIIALMSSLIGIALVVSHFY